MPALSFIEPKSARSVVCPRLNTYNQGTLLDNNNDRTAIDQNSLAQPENAASDNSRKNLKLPSPERPNLIQTDEIVSKKDSKAFTYVYEEETLDQRPLENVKGHKEISPSEYRTHKLPGNKIAVQRNSFMYLDPSAFSIVWSNVILFIVLHSLYFYSFYVIYREKKYYSMLVGYVMGLWGGLGITAGAHRLWSHRSYSARLPLRIFLMIGHTIAGQNNLLVWCRDHRVHHKFSETDGDPHNSLRGFFFAHIGWLLRKKHPAVFIKGQTVSIEDLKADPVVRFQAKYYYFLYALFAFFMPTAIATFLFNEGWWYSVLVSSFLRYGTSLHSTWFVNSAAHMFGQQTYNTNIEARENPFVSYGAMGEGYHNYHHSFPNDYATSELGSSLNTTKHFIDVMAWLGQVYDRKRVSPRLIEMRKVNAAIANQSRKIRSY